MKPFRSIRFVVVLTCVFGLSNLFAQDVVDLSGTVLGADGKPVQGVAVRLDESSLSDTTKADGTWMIQGDIVATKPRFAVVRSMRWLGSDLVTQFDTPTLVHADLFDAAGRRLAVLPSTIVGAGVQSVPLDLPRFSGARWLRVLANGTPTVLSARSGVSAPGIALPRSLAARASGNILVYSLQGQIITEDRLDKLIAANLLQYIKSYTISAKMPFDPRVKVDSVWAWFTGGTMTSPLRARMGFDDINQKVTGTVYTVRPKDAFATYGFKTWLNVMGNGNRLTAVSDTIKFTTDFGIIEWARGFNSSNAFPDGQIVSDDSVEVGTALKLSASMAWQDTSTHRVRDSVIRAEWDLGDGKGWRLAGALPPAATASWDVAGIDTVKLRLMDVDSNIAVIVKAIKVVNSGATLKFGGPTDTTITPSDTVSFQLTVRDTSGVARVIWSYGDGKFDTTRTGNVHAVKHAYPDYRVVGAGKDSTFALTVTIFDSLGGSTSQQVGKVTVSNKVLTGTVSGAKQGLVNTDYPFTVAIAPANKKIAHAEWNIGDGQGWRAGSATSYQAKWLKPGKYAVQVRLTDKDSNRVVLVSDSVAVTNTKTSAQIVSVVDSGLMKPGTMDTLVTPGDTAIFSLKLTDPNGVKKLLWNFGDGTKDSTGGGSAQSIRHIYPGASEVPVNTAKHYALSLTAIDSLGDTTVLANFLSVKDSNDRPRLNENRMRDTVCETGSLFRFLARGQSIGKLKIEWSFGGGQYCIGSGDSSIKLPQVSTDSFNVLVKQTNKRGEFVLDTVRILVREMKALLVDVGPNHTLEIRADSTLWVAGSNTFGQLGDSTIASRSPFKMIMHGVAKISTGGGWTHKSKSITTLSQGFSLVLKSDGSVWAAGRNESGQLGDGTNLTLKTFKKVISSGAVDVSAGGGHSLILMEDGTVWASGSNFFGELGDSSEVNSDKFHKVASDAKRIEAGADNYSVILKNDGTVWTAGNNKYGQLGDSTLTSRPYFAQVASDATEIAAGGSHVLVLKQDGSVWASGLAGYGQFGDGSYNADPLSLKQFHFSKVFPNNVIAIAAGNISSFILLEDHRLLAAGENSGGSLGIEGGLSIEGGVSSILPTFTLVEDGVQSISIGHNTSAIIKLDQSLFFAGPNASGQFGDGTSDGGAPFRRINF